MLPFIPDNWDIQKNPSTGMYEWEGKEYLYYKVCKNPRCQQKFLSNSRRQAYCCPDCNKKHVKQKKSRRSKYIDDYKHLQNLLSRSYSITKQIAELLFLEWKCCECGSEEEIEIHHKDLNPFNNSFGNLELRCKKCHTKIHLSLPKINMLELLKELDKNVHRPISRPAIDIINEFYAQFNNTIV